MTHPILWTVILGGIGVLNTIYLSYHAIRKTYVKCLFFPEESCRKVQESKYSKTMGIPNGFLGFGMYALIFVLALLYHYGAVATFVPALALIFIGFLFSLYFLYLQAFVIKAYCTWCVLSAIDFTLLFLLVFLPTLLR